MAIITRGLGVEEENYWQDSLGHFAKLECRGL